MEFINIFCGAFNKLAPKRVYSQCEIATESIRILKVSDETDEAGLIRKITGKRHPDEQIELTVDEYTTIVADVVSIFRFA